MICHLPDGATVIVVLQHFCSSACHTFFTTGKPFQHNASADASPLFLLSVQAAMVNNIDSVVWHSISLMVDLRTKISSVH